MRFLPIILAATLCSLVGFVGSVGADTAPPALPFLSPIFGSNMVLQRDAKDRVWGWTTPGTTVTVTLGPRTATARAGADGKWLSELAPIAAGGPYTLTVTGPQTIALNNIMMGDVWICSGQSNMAFGMTMLTNGKEEIAAADNPNIRLYIVPNTTSARPRAVFSNPQPPNALWNVCTPENIAKGGWGGFSAVAYYFARRINKTLNVPVGLVEAPWSGMPAEAFVSAGSLKKLADYQEVVQRMELSEDNAKQAQMYGELQEKWYQANDAGTKAVPMWSDPTIDDTAWNSIKVPGEWEQAGIPELTGFDGILWYRTTVDVPEAWAGKDLSLSLGTIRDADTTYFNGTRVGGQATWWFGRNYPIPGNLVKAGKNTIALRVWNSGGNGGGMNAKPETLTLAPRDKALAALTLAPRDKALAALPLSLAGTWKYQIGAPMARLTTAPQPVDYTWPFTPTVLYNSMINPLVPLAIKGVIWYQGESNAAKAYQYRSLMPALITDWRQQFRQGNFPFYQVQLAGFKPFGDKDNSMWAELREAQQMASQAVPNAGIAVAVDIGEPTDIHPKNKLEVGERLARVALAQTYGQKIEYSGPVYKSMRVIGKTAQVTFTHAAGLMAKGDKPTGFFIAGADRNFVPADAVIKGAAVLVSAAAVDKPVAVRYAFSSFPDANLYNAAGLPAVPFRTDAWAGVTVNNH